MDINQAASKKRDRAVYEFTLPDELKGQDPLVKESIGLVKLTMSEEINAANSAGSTQTKLAYAFLRLAFVEVDGRKVNKGEAEDESILENVDPAIRALMLEAYADLANTEQTVAKKFLGTRKMKVG